MKMLPHRFIVNCALAFSALLLGACTTFQDAPDSDAFVFLDKEETLYVRFHMSQDLRIEMAYPDIAESMKEKRIEQYFSLMRNLLHVYRFPMNVHLLEENEAAGDGPLLDLHAYRWEQDRYGEINATVSAKLERYGVVNTLGVFKKTEMPAAMSSQQRTDDMFAQVMDASLSQMFLELMEHFKTEVDRLELEE